MKKKTIFRNFNTGSSDKALMPPPIGLSTTTSSSAVRPFQPVPGANAQIPDLPVPPDTFLGTKTQRAGTDTDPVFPRSSLTPPQAKTRFTAGGLALYPHQAEMCSKVTARLPNSPWVGVASPMQTGKSQGITAVVSEVRDQYNQIIVIADSREGFSQCVSRLSAELGNENVGTFSGSGKTIRKVMVATRHALYKNLAEFDPAEKTLIVLDEAITTQCPSLRRILHHFELGQPETREAKETSVPLTPAQLCRGKFVSNPDTQNRLIGLSATGGGLEGYDVAFRMDMLSAIEQRWLRDIEGEQIFLNPSADGRRSTDQTTFDSVTYQVVDKPGDTQIWWRATKENAKILAKVYFDRIHGKYAGNHIFIPTVRHGKMLLKALEEEFVARGCGTLDDAKALFGFVYSADTVTETTEEGKILVKTKPRDEALNRAELKKWRHGGTVLSIGKLNRSYSATGTGAIFHTYQTASSELFAQRTGRGWGNNKERNLGSLFVLEATWSREQRFMNLARLLGLADYPFGRVDSKNLRQHIPEIRIRKNMGEELDKEITAGTVHPLFGEIPLAARWRVFFRRAADDHAGGLAGMAETTKIPQVYLEGFRQGGLPMSLSQIEALSKTLGDRQTLIERWVLDWMDVATDLKNGTRHLGNPKKFSHVPDQLIDWLNAGYKPAEAEAKAQALDKILSVYFVFPMSGPMVTLLQGALHVCAKYEGWRSLTVYDDSLDGDVGYKICAQSIADVLFGRIGEKQWQQLIHGLFIYFDNLVRPQQNAAPDEPQMTREFVAQRWKDADKQRTLLVNALFERKGWDPLNGTQLYIARWLIIRRFGDRWPAKDIVVPGIPSFTKDNPLTAWITTGERPDKNTAKGKQFDVLVQRLIAGLKVTPETTDPKTFVDTKANKLLLNFFNKHRHLFGGNEEPETIPEGVWNRTVNYFVDLSAIESLETLSLPQEQWRNLAVNLCRLWVREMKLALSEYKQEQIKDNATFIRISREYRELIAIIATEQGWPIARMMSQLEEAEFDFYKNEAVALRQKPRLDLNLAVGALMNLIPLYGLNWPQDLVPANESLDRWLKGYGFKNARGRGDFVSRPLSLEDRRKLVHLEKETANTHTYQWELWPYGPISVGESGIKDLVAIHAARTNGWPCTVVAGSLGNQTYPEVLAAIRESVCHEFAGGFLPDEMLGSLLPEKYQTELMTWLSGKEPPMTANLEKALRTIAKEGNCEEEPENYLQQARLASKKRR